MAPAHPIAGTAAPVGPSGAPSGGSAPGPESARHLVDGLAAEFRSTAESLVPWFVAQMPAVYFQDTSPAEQREHLRALIAARASGRSPDMNFRSADGRSVTAIRTESRSGVLAEILASLPTDASLRAAKIHTSVDGSLVLDTFEFGERTPYNPNDPVQAAKVKEAAGFARTLHPDWTDESQRTFFDGFAADYLLTRTPYRLCHHQDLFLRAIATDLSRKAVRDDHKHIAALVVDRQVAGLVLRIRRILIAKAGARCQMPEHTAITGQLEQTDLGAGEA